MEIIFQENGVLPKSHVCAGCNRTLSVVRVGAKENYHFYCSTCKKEVFFEETDHSVLCQYFVKPKMFILEIEDLEVFENFIVEWVNHDPVVHLHQYRPDIEVQILDITYDIMLNQFRVTISDSYYSLVATLDRSMNFAINHKMIEVFDIVRIKQTSGHPSRFSFHLVSFTNHCFILYLYYCVLD